MTERVVQWLALASWRPQLRSGFLFALSLWLTEQQSVGQKLSQRVRSFMKQDEEFETDDMTAQNWHSKTVAEQERSPSLQGPNVAGHPMAYLTYF